MPRRVYTLASMNSVDKSIAPLDTALRRRFSILNLDPDLGEVAKAMGIEEPDPSISLTMPVNITSPNEVKQLALAVIAELNSGICHFLGAEFQLGQWYLKGLCKEFGDTQEALLSLQSIWIYNIFPQLEELFHSRTEQLAAILKINDHGQQTITSTSRSA